MNKNQTEVNMSSLRKITLISLILTITNSDLLSFITFGEITTFYRPYDINYRTDLYKISDSKIGHLKIGTTFEIGGATKSLDESGSSVSLLSIYHNSESSLAMLQGAPEDSKTAQLANELNTMLAGATDDGKRGRIKFHAKFKEMDYNIYTSYWFQFYKIPGYFHFATYLPIRSKLVKNLSIEDLTADKLTADLVVKELVTDNLKSLVKELGGLELEGWNKTGIGDLTFMVGWQHNFRQHRRVLKNVRLTARAGMSVPTSTQNNENNPFSMPLGYNGAFTFPILFGIDLYLKHNIKTGVELEILQFTDVTRKRRLKTAKKQTEFLLLNKGLCRLKQGDLWKFNVYLQAEHFYRGLSAMVAYQFSRNFDNKIILKTSLFNNEIVNSAENLQDWTYQLVAFQLNYDFEREISKFFIRPQISLYYKIPVAGHRILTMQSFGGQLVLNF